MQKKLIALAVAGLVSAPVFAQSNVQIYGIVDIGFTHQSSSQENGAHAGLKNRSGVDSSQSATSRIGFRGTEDLGNGLKAFFTIENQLNPDRDSNLSGGNRQSFLGLEGGFGRVWAGRDFNPSRAFWTNLDPFGATGFGSNQNVVSQTSRFSNAAFYRTPNFGGLTVTGAYSQQVANATGADEVVRVKGSGIDYDKGWSITPVYKNGGLTLGGGYERYSNADIKRWNLGGGYDFGVVDLSLGYSQTKFDAAGAVVDKSKSWLLGAAIPVSESGKLLASYARTNQDVTGGDRKAQQFAVGYLHSLSKRTALYATYAKVKTNSNADGLFGVSGQTTNVADPVNGGTAALTSGVAVGVRHSF